MCIRDRPYGYYNEYTTSNYAFYGAEGVDFEKLMTIDTLDFGTPHLYLDQWGMKHTGTGQDDLLWFKIHGETLSLIHICYIRIIAEGVKS